MNSERTMVLEMLASGRITGAPMARLLDAVEPAGACRGEGAGAGLLDVPRTVLMPLVAMRVDIACMARGR